jgi:hypothetical protein
MLFDSPPVGAVNNPPLNIAVLEAGNLGAYVLPTRTSNIAVEILVKVADKSSLPIDGFAFNRTLNV